MKKALLLVTTLGLGIVITVTTILVWATPPAQVEGQAAASTELLNGTFEGDYQSWEGADARRIAPSWNLWYTESWPGEPYFALPKTSPAQGSGYSRSGKAQGVHSDGDHNFAACVYQQIEGLTPGHVLRFAAWA